MTGIRARLLGIVLLATLPLLLLSLDNIRVYRERDVERVWIALIEQSRAVGQLLESLIGQARVLSLALASDGPHLVTMPLVECNAKLHALRKADSRIPFFTAVIDDRGWSACGSYEEPPTPIYLGDQPHIAKARQTGNLVIGGPVATKRDNERIIPIAHPFYDRDGRHAGIVSVIVPILWLESNAKQYKLQSRASLQIHDASDSLVLAIGEGPRVDIDVVRRKLDTTKPHQLLELENLFVGVSMLASGFVVTMTVDQTQVMGVVAEVQMRNILISVAVLLCGLTLAWLFAKRAIVTRIEALAGYGDRLGRGELDAGIVGSDSPDEFGRLAKSLETMAKRLRERIEALADREAVARHAAEHDPLTGAVNRRGFDAIIQTRLDLAGSMGSTVALLLVDLDHFKRVNDLHGHQHGDHVLRVVVQRKLEIVRREDVLARIGGDEFAILVTSGDDHAARLLAKRLIEALAREIDLPMGIPVRIGASIGIACFPRDARTPSELLQCADQALYVAKDRGRGCAAMARRGEQGTAVTLVS